MRSVDRHDLAFLHRDGKAARVRTIERARGFNDRAGAAVHGIAGATIEFSPESPCGYDSILAMKNPKSAPRVVIIGGGFGGSTRRAHSRAPTRRSRSSIATTIICFSPCSIRWRPPRSRRATWRRRSGGSPARAEERRGAAGERARDRPVGRRVILDPCRAGAGGHAQGESIPYDYLLPRCRRGARVLRPSRVGRTRARAEDTGRCAGDAAGACCWRSKRRSARATRSRQRRLLTFVIVGGGPTGVELAGALAEIARQSLLHDFRRIRPGVRADCAARRQSVLAAAVSRFTARGGAPRARAARRRGPHGNRLSSALTRMACSVGPM